MGIWEWWGKCQGDLLYRVINWMLYGNVSIQGRCDLGEDWEWLGWGLRYGRWGLDVGFVGRSSGSFVGIGGVQGWIGTTECN